jgi:hypothetical protein
MQITFAGFLGLPNVLPEGAPRPLITNTDEWDPIKYSGSCQMWFNVHIDEVVNISWV